MKFVEKRDGRKEEFNVNKIKKVIEWATQGLDVNPLALECKFDEFIRDGIKTDDIQQNLIYHSRVLCTPEEPEWSVVAGRLETMLRWKTTQIFEKTFAYYLKEQIDAGIYKHPALSVWTKNEINQLGAYIVQERDLAHSYGSVLTAHSKYLMPNECIQQMFMVNAMIIASPEQKDVRLSVAKKIYDALSLRKISLATPWLSNLRRDGNISSCFIIQVDDSMESIADNWKNAAMISKNGGGLGIDLSNIRAKGSEIAGRPDSSKGVTSWAKIFNDIAVSVDQGGTRAGAFTIHIPIWHRDIEDFIEIQTENGDFRKKAFDIFPQIGIMDSFMREATKDDGGVWYTFCPYEVQNVMGFSLVGVFGKDFVTNYRKCVTAYNNGKLKNVGKYNAKELLKSIMRVQFETGLPYLAFLDRMNEQNPNSHEGYIPCTNLCVAPETQILTDVGYKVISELEDQYVNIWNGEDWSKVRILKTGENQKLLEVHTNSGEVLSCTEYHRFPVVTDYTGKWVIKRAHELQPGDKLMKFDLPLIEGEKELPFAYDNGFFSGDGNVSNGVDRIYLYHEKRELAEHFGSVESWYDDTSRLRLVGKARGLKPKYFVPDASYTIKSRLEWLAGWLDADGTIARNGTNESIQISSVEPEFLREVQLMLQTLGVRSKVVAGRDEGVYDLPANDGTDGNKAYHCRKSERLLISSSGLFRLAELGFKTKRLKWTKRLPQRNAEQFITIKEVVDAGRYDDTYCFMELKRNMGMFNGFLSMNCVESYSNVVADKYAHTCNLASVVVGRIDSDEEMIEIARLCARILDNGIELTNPPVEISKAHNNRYRTIGIGIQGLHDYVARHGISWDDTKAFTRLAELIEYGAVTESVELAKLRGKYPAFDGSKWDNGEMIARFKEHTVATELCDWDKVAEDLRQYGIRNSQLTSPAPNTSTSIFMDASPGVMPVYSAFYNEDNKTGKFSVYGMYIKEYPLAYEQTAPRQDQVKLAKMVGALQKFVDTGISAEYIFDQNNPDFSAKSLYDLIVGAWKAKTKAIYYIRSIKKGQTIDHITGGESVCVGCAG